MECFTNNTIGSSDKSIHYTLIESIGEGGFGHVFKARNNETGLFVAIKFLTLSAHCDDESRQRHIRRFERESRLGTVLNHPNIVRLLDHGRNGNLFYSVFEFIEGKTLKQTLLEQGALTPLDALDFMMQVSDALNYAHKKGVIHRDIKPSNIMLSREMGKLHAKILDFGIASTVLDECELHDWGFLGDQENLGTPAYSAPEQLRGEPATPASDIYAWGLVFCECLTGRPALTGSSVLSIYRKQLSYDEVPLPDTLMEHPVSCILIGALKKKKLERTADAASLCCELARLDMSHLKIEPPPAGMPFHAEEVERTQINASRYFFSPAYS